TAEAGELAALFRAIRCKLQVLLATLETEVDAERVRGSRQLHAVFAEVTREVGMDRLQRARAASRAIERQIVHGILRNATILEDVVRHARPATDADRIGLRTRDQ